MKRSGVLSWVIAAGLLVQVAGLCAACDGDDVAAPAAAGDLARLQGTWHTNAGPRGKLPITLTIDGDHVVVEIRPAVGKPLRAEGTIAIDDTAQPHALDWVGFRVPGGDDVPDIAAIYRWDGESLIICNGGPSNPRPAEFVAGDGVLAQLLRFERTPDRVASRDPEGSLGR